MSESSLFHWLLYVWIALGLITLPALFFFTAPYGRHFRQGFGFHLPSTIGWVVMELPSVVVFAVAYFLGDKAGSPTTLFMVALWELHYLQRTFIFPLRRRGGHKPMPLLIAASAFFFTSVNGYLNGRSLSQFSADYPESWQCDPRFIIGVLLFLVGFVLNFWADQILINLRKPKEEGYQIPYGGLYRWVSCPNYLTEIVEWIGWALCTWSLAGASFAIWTIANLLPRARDHHRWYLQAFPDYPKDRKAIIPFIY